MFRHLRSFSQFVQRYGHCRQIANTKSIFGGIILSSVHAKINDTDNNYTYAVDASQLSTGYLTKMAVVQTVNSATTLLTHSLTVLLDVLDNYTSLLNNLLALMELHLTVYGNEYREDRVWDAMMEMRLQISECKRQKEELEIVFHCAENALQAAGEAAHITGADYAGMAANERVFSATQQLKHKRLTVEEVEAKIRQMEVKTIEEISKNAEETAKEKESASQTENHKDPTSGEKQDITDNEDNDNNNPVKSYTKYNDLEHSQKDSSDETNFVIVNGDDFEMDSAKMEDLKLEDMNKDEEVLEDDTEYLSFKSKRDYYN